jgi:aspartate/methionine/tyrosine aminotransferase
MTAVREVVRALASWQGPTSEWIVGEPCFDPPEALQRALARAAMSTAFPYSPPTGLPELRELLASRHLEGGEPLQKDQIAVTNGAKGGLLALLASVLEPGDELIHPSPSYPAYPAIARRLGAHPIAVPEQNGSFEGWAEAVEQQITHRTRAVVLASPSNPTGATLASTQSRELVALCRDRRVRLICDEAYVDFRFAADSDRLPAEFDPARKTVIQIRSASKSWAVCGWRMGWVAADPEMVERVAATHAALVNPAPGPTQKALLSLDAVPSDHLTKARVMIAERIGELCARLEKRRLTVRRPSGGFYLWLDLSRRAGEDSVTEFCVDLATNSGIGLWPGEDFGAADHARIAVTSPTEDEWGVAVEALVGSL